MKNQSDPVIAIIFIALFLGVFLFGAVVTITSLNTANKQAGTTIPGNVDNESLLNDNATQTLFVNGLYNAQCSNVRLTDLAGIEINASNYTVNNCEVVYNP